MITGHYFRRIERPRPICAGATAAGGAALMSLLSRCVLERFVRIGDGSVTGMPLALLEPGDGEDPPPNPCHLACAEYAASDYCRESWQLHLAELNSAPQTHWHNCDYGMLCAVVPVVYQGRCLAAVKITCPASLPQEAFERQVELMDVLVKDFTVSQADLLTRFVQAHPAG
ncbi:MAG: hypothetical protein HY718_06000, partial [Planctomycetes bacterium]|nr:hypothetical protein [Planctomycetota bacterium]